MPTTSTDIIAVAVPLPLAEPFSYRVPASLRGELRPGCRVLVPFGRRSVVGFVLGPGTPTGGELKEVRALLDAEPLLFRDELDFLEKVARYYQHPLGNVIRTALPAGLMGNGRQTGKGDADAGDAGVSAASRTRIRLETCYRLADGAQLPETLRGKAVGLFTFLQSAGEASAPLLRQQFGDCGAPLRRLQELELVRRFSREVYRDPFKDAPVGADTPRPANPDQQAALASVGQALQAGGFAPFLLHGVTGSGKTEVYLQAISQARELGRTALVLVPEIGLTPQLVRRFRARFGDAIAVLHSGLSDGERYDQWRRIRRGEASIVIGARSAIFAPLRQLGIIVVDEEHDPSYKQGDGLRYNARDLALLRGQQAAAVVLLGSATPLVTSYHAAHQGRLGYLELPERVAGRPLPSVELADLRGGDGLFSPPLAAALAETLASGGQALLFLNRRGFATCLVCNDCGATLRCPNCAVTLTHHRARGQHRCHYCDFSMPAPSVCPACQGGEFVLLGQGTERLEAEVREQFPTARVARMDRDTTAGKDGHGRVLGRLERGEIDILVGTQMLAKGHDFPGVTLVGVLNADATLHFPDFRSAERTFQLVTQVAGRAGRGDQPGRVIVQTLSPEHHALQAALHHDYRAFYQAELPLREELGYPPFAHLAMLQVSAPDNDRAANAARSAAARLQALKNELRCRVQLLGPAPAPLARLRNRYRWQLLIKGEERPQLHRLLARFQATFVPPATVQLLVDIDPLEML